ncbi:MAG: 30S ribosomal protein S20 [Phycisphaerales bacterium]
MAHSLSAKKRVRQNAKRRALNRWRMKSLRRALRDFETQVSTGSVEQAREAQRVAASLLDRTASKGVIHRNTAARKKSRINKRLKAKALSNA